MNLWGKGFKATCNNTGTPADGTEALMQNFRALLQSSFELSNIFKLYTFLEKRNPKTT